MDTAVLIFAGGVFAVGAVVILLGQLLGARPAKEPQARPAGERGARVELVRELWRLYLFELAIVGSVVLPAYLGSRPFLLAVALLALVAQSELYRVLVQPGRRAEQALLACATLTILAAGHSGGEPALLAAVLSAALIVLVSDLSTPPSPARAEATGRLLLIVIYPVTCLAFLAMLRDRPAGFLLVAFLYAVVETTDSFALLAGKLFGRRKAFPVLTPGKTWEGLAGGLASGGLAGVLFGLHLTPFSPRFVVLGTVVSLIATLVGDLAASKIKRNLGIKDFASTTAHGGILDIYDSLIFAAPVLYGLTRILTP